VYRGVADVVGAAGAAHHTQMAVRKLTTQGKGWETLVQQRQPVLKKKNCFRTGPALVVMLWHHQIVF